MLFLLELALATWRLSHLLMEEKGPNGVLIELRSHFGIGHDGEGVPVRWPESGGVGEALGCIWCTSLWIASALAISPRAVRTAAAASAAVILFQEWRENHGTL